MTAITSSQLVPPSLSTLVLDEKPTALRAFK